MNNFINFFNTFLSYVLLLIIIVIVMFIAIKLGILWSKKKDAKALELEKIENDKMEEEKIVAAETDNKINDELK